MNGTDTLLPIPISRYHGLISCFYIILDPVHA